MSQYSVLWVVATGLEAKSLGVGVELSEGFHPQMPVSGQAILITGVGMLATAVSLSKILAGHTVQRIINIGICGSFRSDLVPGKVVQVIRDELGDFGAEDQTGFLSPFDLGFVQPHDPRFVNRRLQSLIPLDAGLRLPVMNGVTVNTVHGSADSIRQFKERCDADVESMEGAAVFYVAADFGIPVLQVRAVSNFVEPRNRAAWKIKEALAALTQEISVLQQQITLRYS